MTLSAGTADGAVIATDDITSVHYPYGKIGIGADDTFTILVGGNGAAAAGVLRVTVANDSTGVLASVGTVSAFGTGTTGPMKAEDVASQDGDMGIAVWAIRDDTLNIRSGTEGDYEPLHTDANGALWVRHTSDTVAVTQSGTWNVGTVTTVSTVSAFGVSTTGPMKAEDVASANGDMGIAVWAIRDDTLDARSGTEGDYEPFHTNANGALWVEYVNTNIATIGTSVTPGTAAGNLGKAEDAAHSSGDTGVMALGVRAAAPTERSAGPTDGDYEPFGVNEVGAMWVSPTPSANGGLSTFMASGSDGSSILVATKQTIKASAGNLYGWYIYNPEAAASFVHFYNTDTVTVGTTNPQMTLAIPAGAAANVAFPHGIKFDTAISTAATTTAGGNTAPSTGVSLVALYK